MPQSIRSALGRKPGTSHWVRGHQRSKPERLQRSRCDAFRKVASAFSATGGHAWLALALGLTLTALPGCKSGNDPRVDTNTADGGESTGPNTTNTGSLKPGAAGDGTDAQGSTDCTPGKYRCESGEGTVLEVCDPLSASGWRMVSVCDSAELCDEDSGECLACTPGQYWCDAWRLKSCNRDGTQWLLEQECDSPEYCDSRGGQCPVCLPGDGYCSNATLFSCNVNRDGFTSRECESADLCNVASMDCRPCVPGEYQCSQGAFSICNDDLRWELLEQCATQALCEASIDQQSADPSRVPECVPPVCDDGTFRCGIEDESALYSCPPSRDRWVFEEACATAAACNAEAGACEQGVCSLGDSRCTEQGELQICNDTGTAWETLKQCASPDLCNIAAQDCIPCAEGEVQCNLNVLQTCTEELTWSTTDTCATKELCVLEDGPVAAGYCESPACGNTPETRYRCEGNRLQACNAGRTGYEPSDECLSDALCNAPDGRCDPPTCMVPGEVRCQNNTLVQCREDLTDWEILQQCDTGVCDISIMGCAGECPELPFRCNGALPEQCFTLEDDSIEWRVIGAPCATSGLCQVTETGAGCTPPVCGGSLPDFRCDPDDPVVVQRCNDTRTGWNDTLTCETDQVCDPGENREGPAQCDVCGSGEWSCSGAVLSLCSFDGQQQWSIETCRDAAHCFVADDLTNGYCLRCDPGETQCNGLNVDTCAADQRGWVLAEACASYYGCQDNPGNADYCNRCTAPGATQCKNNDVIHTCNDARNGFLNEQTCSFGCYQTGTGYDYCRDCAPGTAECNAAGSSRRVCGDDGRWGAFAACANGSPCIESGNADYCASCDPGTRTCVNQTQIQGCGSDGRPGAATNCPAANPVCLAASNSCVECAPGVADECTGAAGTSGRRSCASDGSWERDDCSGSSSVCLSGQCVACQPGAVRCNGGTAAGRQVCSAAGSWTNANCSGVTPICGAGGTCRGCQSDGDCDAGLCDEDSGECVDVECLDDGDCSGSTPVCLSDTCVACTPGELICTDTASGRDRCDDSGQWTADDCAASAPICLMGACLECAPDATAECTGDPGTPDRRICDGGEWADADCSAPDPVCSDGECVACVGGAVRCQAGTLQTCDGGNWSDGAACTACSTDAQCSGNTPICGEDLWCVACSVGSCPMGLLCSTQGACVECIQPSDCSGISAGSACIGGSCGCNTSDDCGASAPYCDVDTCRACAVDDPDPPCSPADAAP